MAKQNALSFLAVHVVCCLLCSGPDRLYMTQISVSAT